MSARAVHYHIRHHERNRRLKEVVIEKKDDRSIKKHPVKNKRRRSK